MTFPCRRPPVDRPWVGLARSALIAAACLPFLSVATAPVAADTRTFDAQADARVDEADPATNFGTSQKLRVDADPYARVRSYLRFDVEGLPGPVERARLRIFATSDTAALPILDAVTDDWSEGGVTWTSRPARTGAVAGGGGQVAAGTWFEVDVTSLVAGDGTYDLGLRTGSADGLNMLSRESERPPQLIVDTVDPPSPLAPPAIVGATRVGETVRVLDGGWSGEPLGLAYQWSRCAPSGWLCVDVLGATEETYAITPADTGATLRVTVRAENAGGSASAASAPSSVIAAAETPRGGAIEPPAAGAWLGAWTSPNTGVSIEEREAQIGRRYAIVHRYHDWDNRFPTESELSLAQEGRILFLAVEPRIYGTDTIVPWREIAAGDHDAAIDAMAARVREFGRPLFIDFAHEPEESTAMGTPAEFAAAYRHLRARFDAAGASNVAWVWTVMGYSGHVWQYSGGLYPGDDVVDWIAWDPYNWYRCHGSPWTGFSEKVSGFYDWLVAHGHGDKPFMLAEFGSAEHDDDPLAKGAWFDEARVALSRGEFPNLKALVYFDSRPSECDWRLDTSQASLDGFRRLAADPYLSPSD